jgi:hypothetical protein
MLAMIAVPACSAADDAADRPPADAGRDTRVRYDVEVDRRDARESDGAGDGETPGADATPDLLPPPDALDAPVVADAAAETSVPDATVDGAAPRDADATSTPGDAAVDPTITTCLVSFTVTGVRWDAEGGAPDGQASARVVRLVGDAANLGSWSPTAGLLLMESGAGTWSGAATFRDQQIIEFKFVKLEGVTPEWETWQPFDSNRSLRVECTGDAGALDATEGGLSDVATNDGADVASDAADASSTDAPPSDAAPPDATPLDATSDAAGDDATSDAIADVRVTTGPARGRSYTGVFGVRPADATK